MNIEAIRTVSDQIARPRIMLLHPGWIVLAASLALTMIGIRAIDLASVDGAQGLAPLARKQMVFIIVGLLGAAAAVIPRPRTLADAAWPFAVLILALLLVLIAPFVPASIVSPRNGARCWINLGVTDLQPSELAKIAYVMVLALYLRHRSTYRTLLGLIPPAIIASVPIGLILMQPDLGTAVLFIPTLVAMLVAAGARLGHLIGACLLGVVFIGVVVGVSLYAAQNDQYPLLKKYQVERIQTVTDRAQGESRHLDSRGFQQQQAITVAGAGRIAGHDPDRSRALIRFSGLPERHNDMIFAVIVNRFGLLGAMAVIGLYFAWISAALLAAGMSKDPFGRLVIVGLAALVATQVTINIGMNLGIMPITGITLPFISYGGSSLVSGFLMVGLIFNIAMRRPPHLWRESFEFDERGED